MVDIILIGAAVAILVALIALRRKPKSAPQPQAKAPVSTAAPEARQPGGRLAAALAASPQRPPGAQAPGVPGAGHPPMAGASPAGGAPFPAAQPGGCPSPSAPSPVNLLGGYPSMAAPSPVGPAGSCAAVGPSSPVSPSGNYPSAVAPSLGTPAIGYPPVGVSSPVTPAGSCPPVAAPPGDGMQQPPFTPAARATEPQGTPTTLLERTAGAFLEVVTGDDAGRRFTLTTGDNRIGRGPNNRLRLTDRTVSNQHAIVRMAPGQALLFDDSSTNGTYLNGQRVLQPRPLSPGDRITLGRTVLQFHLESEEASLAG